MNAEAGGGKAERAVAAEAGAATREALAAALRERGLEPILFRSAQDALRAVLDRFDDRAPPRLAFLGVGRDPDSEAALVSALRERFGPRLPVIALLSDAPASPDPRADRLAAACDAILLTPLRPGALRAVLAAALRAAPDG